MAQEAKTIQCHQCKNNECLAQYPQGIPEYCQAQRFLDLIEESKRQYLEPDADKFHTQAVAQLTRAYMDFGQRFAFHFTTPVTVIMKQHPV
ncbi:MAG: hypothetical protein U9M91_02165 [Chloroflexota bacterium]|nr:hypothetical protein [Chloroflexota bacterium]